MVDLVLSPWQVHNSHWPSRHLSNNTCNTCEAKAHELTPMRIDMKKTELNVIRKIDERGFVSPSLKANKLTTFHTDKITKQLGNPNRDPSRKVINNILHRVENSKYVIGVKSHTYLVNYTNICHYWTEANLWHPEIELDFDWTLTDHSTLSSFKGLAQNKQAKTLLDVDYYIKSGAFSKTVAPEYKIGKFSQRLTSSFQSASKSARKLYFKNWHDYDIEAAAYSLLHQYYDRFAKPWWASPIPDLPHMQQVYQKKNEIREKLAVTLDLPQRFIKELLQSILFNITISVNPYSGLFKSLQENYNQKNPYPILEKINENEFIQELQKELKIFWHIVSYYWVNQNNKKPKEYKKEIIDESTGEIKSRTSRTSFRAAVYFKLERETLDIALPIISLTNKPQQIRLIHDGFFTENPVDLDLLKQTIKTRTSFDLNFSYEIM